MSRLALAALAAGAILASGCGEESADGSGESASTAPAEMRSKAPPAPVAARPSGTAVKAIDSGYGRVIADRRGEAFYLFGRETDGESRCYGACASAWPPVLTKGRPLALAGAEQRLLATSKRKGGRLQVTYAGRPLYYYVSDSPGNILCHDVVEFGGRWLVVKPSGKPAV